MTEPRLVYGARSEAEQQRNLARLGTRWQENTTPELYGWLGLSRYPSPPGRLTEYEAGYRDGYRDAYQRGWFWGWFWRSWK